MYSTTNANIDWHRQKPVQRKRGCSYIPSGSPTPPPLHTKNVYIKGYLKRDYPLGWQRKNAIEFLLYAYALVYTDVKQTFLILLFEKYVANVLRLSSAATFFAISKLATTEFFSLDVETQRKQNTIDQWGKKKK